MTTSQALGELLAARNEPKNAALIPENDGMVVGNAGAIDLAKADLYRSEIGQPLVSSRTQASSSQELRAGPVRGRHRDQRGRRGHPGHAEHGHSDRVVLITASPVPGRHRVVSLLPGNPHPPPGCQAQPGPGLGPGRASCCLGSFDAGPLAEVVVGTPRMRQAAPW